MRDLGIFVDLTKKVLSHSHSHDIFLLLTTLLRAHKENTESIPIFFVEDGGLVVLGFSSVVA